MGVNRLSISEWGTLPRAEPGQPASPGIGCIEMSPTNELFEEPGLSGVKAGQDCGQPVWWICRHLLNKVGNEFVEMAGSFLA